MKAAPATIRGLVLFFGILNSNCLGGCLDDRYGFLGISSDREESQKRGVWVCDYTPVDSMLVIGNTIHLPIKEAYVEHVWRYGKKKLSETTVFPADGYWFVVNFTDDANLQNMTFTWSIGSSWQNSFRRTSKHSIVLEIKEIPDSDSIHFPIFIGNVRHMNGIPVKVGEFVLKRGDCTAARTGKE